MVIRPFLSIAAASLLASCACFREPQVVERVVVQKVEVPVTVTRPIPAELDECRYSLRPPLLEPAPSGLLLPVQEIETYVAFIGGVARCDDAWRAWAAE